MGKVEQITIGLPVDMADAVKKAVAEGEFATTSEAVIAALKDWQESREHFGRSDDDLGALWDAGISSGRGDFQSADEIIAEAKQRSASKY